MMDNRIALNPGTELQVDKNKTVQIKNEVGRGASCIVYDALYVDSLGVGHNVRIKECYPWYLSLNRGLAGVVEVSDGNFSKFEDSKDRFISAYKRSVEIRNTIGLINSTINSMDSFSLNGTSYVMMSFDEGTDYRAYEDISLKELLKHIQSLAELIKKYHQNGYLYLDIKPENVLVLPETEEHILLFDFDSVITLEELRTDPEFRLSFSDGFSAPEQVQGKIKDVGACSDIYSIGALLFYKIFGKEPGRKDCKCSSRYDFTHMKYADKRYQPKLFRKLSEFFRNSISISTALRWDNVQLMIDAIDELIPLSDIDKVYVHDNFQYNSAYFVGRQIEVDEVHNALMEEQLVFLSGIGGIGKTEIAKKYVTKYREQYNNVVFSVFSSTIRALVCDDNEIVINGISREENEEEQDYFERKLNGLKEILIPDDLVIIDNFDVDDDENIEYLDRLFGCNCKFIITTREDFFRDYNYRQISIKKIDDIDEIMQLFEIYNDKEYSDKEKQAIKKILDFIDNHTMTVELIAKYLRDSNDSPIDLYNKFLDKEGIVNTGDIRVRQRKDRKPRSVSVNNHLRILFDVSNFDNYEKEIISSLSLFTGIRISKMRFEEMCKINNVKDRLEVLIKRGWVEYNDISGKISLHQIIQDLIYSDLMPDADQCPHIVEGMKAYITTDKLNSAERKIQRSVFNTFMERLSGNTISYANLCLIYGKEPRLNEAEEICLKSTDPEAFDILQRVYRKKIEIISECNDMAKSDEDLDEYCVNRILKISDLFDKVLYYCKKNNNPEYIVHEFVEIGMEVDEALAIALDYMAIGSYWSKIPELDEIYNKIINMFDIATEKIVNVELPNSEKERLYKRIRDFYHDEDDFTYRCDHFADEEKAYWYQEQINILRGHPACDYSTSTLYSTDDVELVDLGEEYEEKGDYDKAIECYERAYQTEEEDYGLALYNMARISMKAEKPEKAVGYLEKILIMDKEFEQDTDIPRYTGYACLELIRILISLHEYEKVKKYACELIQFNKQRILEDDNAGAVTYVLSAYYQLYVIEKDREIKSDYWCNCLQYFEMLGNNDIEEDLYDFIYFYICKLDCTDASFKKVNKLLRRISDGKGSEIKTKILKYVISKAEDNAGCERWHIIFLIKYAELIMKVDIFNNEEEALQYCVLAQDCYNKYGLSDEYIQNLIYRATAGCILSDPSCGYEQVYEIKKKCNFILLAEKDIEDEESLENKIDVWEKAAVEYGEVNNYEDAVFCIERALDVMLPILNINEYNQFCEYWVLMENLIKAYINLGNSNETYSSIETLYTNTIDNFKNCVDEPNNFNKKNLLEKIRNLAEYLGAVNKFEMKANILIIGMYLCVSNNAKLELIKEMDIKEEKLKVICEEIEMSVCEESEAEIVDIDLLIELKDIINNLQGKLYDFSIYGGVIQSISAKYQYREIEFKKE